MKANEIPEDPWRSFVHPLMLNILEEIGLARFCFTLVEQSPHGATGFRLHVPSHKQ